MSTTELVKLSAAEMAAKIKAKEVSSRELVEAHLAVIESAEPSVKAFLKVSPLMQALRRPWPCTHGLPNTPYQACSHAPTILPHGSAVSSSPEKRISNNDPSACPAEMVSKGRKMRFPDNCVSHTAHIVMAMPTFSREEIVHLGDLARIALTDEEITRLQGELNVIADSINKVQEVASDDVPPTANPVPLEAYLRPDVAETPLTQEEALAGGPKTEAGMFVAPRILGSEE